MDDIICVLRFALLQRLSAGRFAPWQPDKVNKTMRYAEQRRGETSRIQEISGSGRAPRRAKNCLSW